MTEPGDPGLEALLPLDGEVFFVDPDGKYYVKFVIKRVAPTPDRPHGLSYSLTLHDRTGAVWWDSTMPMRWLREAVRAEDADVRGIIVIGSGRSDLTTIATRRRFSRISGSRSTQC